MTTKRARRGDVFLVPIDEQRVGLGQVVEKLGPELYLAIFRDAWDQGAPPVAEGVGDLEVAFASLSLDAKLWHGHWTVIGNQTGNLERIALPVYKIRRGSDVFAESLDEKRTRKAEPEEIALLLPRKTVAPVRLEMALKALHGVIEWDGDFDELAYARVERSAVVKP